MKYTLMFLALALALLTPTTSRAEKWLVGSSDRILGKMEGKIFVTCEGKRRLDPAQYSPALKLADAPKMYCPTHIHLDSVSDDDDSGRDAMKKEKQQLDKILSEYKLVETQ
jgi:hypothetical protein